MLVSDFVLRHGEHSKKSSQKAPPKYGCSFLAQRIFYDWVDTFRSRRTNVTVLAYHG